MVTWSRTSKSLSLLGLALSCGCQAVPPWQMRQAQLQTLDMYRQNQMLSAQMGQEQQNMGQLAAEKQQMELALETQKQNLELANQRLANLNNERSQLHDRYRNLLAGLHSSTNPLPGGANRRFEELAKKYPDFEFDPQTGVSKFNGDLLFASGSDELRSEAHKLLHEFVQILNDSDAKQFNILVVGHTDDKAISKAGTRQKHPTNWDLSAHRATSVVKSLAGIGMAEHRMGVAGYSSHQPLVANQDDGSRQRNRRVEIYVLAPDADVASLGPHR